MKKFIFALISILIIFGLLFLLFFTADILFHRKYLNIGGLNYKGYRGKILGKKQSNEIRIALVGGSFIFGYGVKYYEAPSSTIQTKLQQISDSKGLKKKITVINLAYNSEGSYSLLFNLQDFSYLDYDIVVLCEGYNDLGFGNTGVYRHTNPIFRTFGYMPILPLIINEKIMVISNNGRLEEAYWGKKVVFKQSRQDSVKISFLDGVLKTYNSLEGAVGRIKKIEAIDFDSEKLKSDRWSWYKHFMGKAIDYSLKKGKKVIVLTQPYLNDAHREQQASLKNLLDEKYQNNNNFFYLNLDDSIPLKDPSVAFDGVHLTAKGCKMLADLIGPKIENFVLQK